MTPMKTDILSRFLQPRRALVLGAVGLATTALVAVAQDKKAPASAAPRPALTVSVVTPQQARLGNVTVEQVVEMNLPAGSMGPKVAAACGFATQTKNEAVIGSLADIDRIVVGTAGTRVRAG